MRDAAVADDDEAGERSRGGGDGVEARRQAASSLGAVAR
jgi:hypothetical protein